jgi:phenylalanyl-tRNA synthetase alpha chain
MSYGLDDIPELMQAGVQAFEDAATPEQLEDARRRYLGQKGILKALLGGIKDVPKEQRGAFGKAANELNKAITQAFENARARVGDAPAAGPGIDLTKPGTRHEPGRQHILTQTVREIVDIFNRLGFAEVEGPEVEDEFHNFDALNIPEGHPARNPEDNFYLQVTGDGDPKPVPLLLRSQTSTIQVRTMEGMQPPVRVIAPGRVYRPDTVDATHHFMFHQIEGLAVAEGLHFGDLKAVLELFVREYFGEDTRMRFRPHYFPFTEPSAEVDIDCRMFKHLKKPWLEILGCGMVDPNVLRAVGYDPERYTGFAFGMGVERIAMLKHRIPDIRHFTTGDVRFLRQF